MDILERLAKDNDEWLRMAIHITGNEDDASELVQDFYLQMFDLSQKKEVEIEDDGYFNYIFICLRNLSRQKHKKNKQDDNFNWLELESTEDQSNDNIQAKEEFEEMYQHIDNYLKYEYKQDTKNFKVGLLKLNQLEGMSYRKIAEHTGITLRVVQTSIVDVRNKIKTKYQKQYDEYKNKK